MHPTNLEMLVRAYEQERLAEAQRLRLLHLAKKDRTRMFRKLLSACGDVLIQAGMKLKTRCESTFAQQKHHI